MPRIPFSFDIEGEDDITEQLSEVQNGEMLQVSWSLVGATVSCKGDKNSYLNLDSVAEHTAGFRLHSACGYSIGQFSEVFAAEQFGEDSYDLECKFGPVEVTFGRPTPLGIRLFDNYHDGDQMPGWDGIHSIRILGATAEKVELYLLNALWVFRRHFPAHLMLLDFPSLACPTPPPPHSSEDDGGDEDPFAVREPITHAAAAAYADIEPLRFMYAAQSETDAVASFLQYYRVLEYYAALQIQAEVSSMRGDAKLGAREFLVALLKAVAKDELGQLTRLSSAIADKQIILEARNEGLCSGSDPADLARALYEFRNSVVHAKTDFRASMHSESIFSPSTVPQRWRNITAAMATKAIQHCARLEL